MDAIAERPPSHAQSAIRQAPSTSARRCQLNNQEEKLMNDELVLRQVLETAWAVCVATHGDADVADQPRCSLSRPPRGEMAGGRKRI